MKDQSSRAARASLRTRLRRAFCATTGTHCRMELQGNRVLWIQGCHESEQYSPTCMVLRVRDASLTRICVTGEQLLCGSYHEDGVEIHGEIVHLQLCGEGE